MFLMRQEVYLSINGNNINNILSWIERHPIIAGSVICVITTGGGFFWYKFRKRKHIKQTQVEASIGFYARILLQLGNLRVWLEEKNLLEVCEMKNGNIYSLIYNADTLTSEFPSFDAPNEVELNELKELVLQLEKTLVDAESNVYPKNADKKTWYDSQHIVVQFCNFIKQDTRHYSTNKTMYESEENYGEYKHIVKCKEFITAMDYIQSCIEEEMTELI